MVSFREHNTWKQTHFRPELDHCGPTKLGYCVLTEVGHCGLAELGYCGAVCLEKYILNPSLLRFLIMVPASADSHQAAVLLPGFREARSCFLSGHQDLHLLKAGMVPQLCLKGQFVLRWRLTWTCTYITPE